MSSARVLVVCTGNVCRSPYVEAVLRHEVPTIDVSSAGTHALVGEDMTPETRQLLDEAGVPAPVHTARLLTPELLVDADLVLVATREHRAAVVRTLPKANRRVFVVRDLTDLAETVTDDQLAAAGAEGPDAVVRLLAGRRGRVAPRDAAHADLTDPYRRSSATYRSMAREIAETTPQVLRVLRHL